MWSVQGCAMPPTGLFGSTRYELERAAMITKDEDFADRSIRVSVGPMIVWPRLGNASNRALREWLMPRLPNLLDALGQGNHRLIEIR